MDEVVQDVRYGLRALRRAPSYAIVAALTLALGIGANTAIFSVVETVLLRPPAGVVEPERVVYLFTSDYSGPAYGRSSYPDVEEVARATDVFAAVSAFDVTAVTLEAGEALARAPLHLGVVAEEVRLPAAREARPELGLAVRETTAYPEIMLGVGALRFGLERDPHLLAHVPRHVVRRELVVGLLDGERVDVAVLG